MKKILLVLFMSLTVGFATVKQNSNTVFADEIGENVNDDIVNDSDISIDDTTDNDVVEDNNQDYIHALEQKVNELLTQTTAGKIVSYVLESGLLLTLIIFIFKYMGANKTIKKIEDNLNKRIDKNFKSLSIEQKELISKYLIKIVSDVETLKVAVALSQDKSEKSKIALLKMITESTESKEIQKSIDEVKTQIEKDKELKENVINKIGETYKDIF